MHQSARRYICSRGRTIHTTVRPFSRKTKQMTAAAVVKAGAISISAVGSRSLGHIYRMLCWYSLLAGTLRKLIYEYVQPARPTTRLHLRYHETFYHVSATYVNRAVGVRVLYEVNSSTAAEESLRRPSESWCMMSVEAAFSGGC
ncbi:unnamed protein product, partial [Pylaiella littoralis]